MALELVAEDGLGAALERIGREVDAGFDAALPVPPDARAPLVEAMRYAAIGGGKRVRPLLLTASAEMLGVARAGAVKAALAVEAIHVYSLIHDDLPCMDDDDLRRGKPTLHVKFGEATAVLAGDSLHALAFEIIADPAAFPDPFIRAELTRVLAGASGMNGMAGGQMMDMAAEDAVYDLPAITRMQQLKTGALLGAAVEMGCALAKLPAEGRGPYRAYARDVGLAFQIADDLLDVSGDEAAAGKALRKDAGAGKATFVSLMGEDAARDQARMLVEQAVGHLGGHGAEAALLRDLARYIVERDR